MTNLEIIIYSSLIILFASSVQGSIGFGFSLISLPLLSLFTPLQTLIPILVILSVAMNIMIIFSIRNHLDLKRIWLLILMGFVGIPIGVYALNSVNPSILQFMIGIFIIATSIAMLMGFHLETTNKKLSYSITGFVSGVLNGSISMSGPPIVLFLTNEGYDKQRFRANISAYFILTNVMTILIFSFNRMIDMQVIQYTGIYLVVLLIGTLIGITVSHKLNEVIFKRAVLLLLIISGITALLNSFHH